MVLGDLSSHFQNPNGARKLPIAASSERFLAFFFDVILFTPIFSVLLSQIFKKLELKYYTSPDSAEFLVFSFTLIFGVVFLTALTQAFFIYYFQGSPGKLIFKLRVLNFNTGQKPTLGNSLLRSALWTFEFFLLGIPFLEILSHQHRRILHDRASETMVVTLKKATDPGPHPLEMHFVRNILFICVTLFGFWGSLLAGKVYVAAVRGDFKKQELEKDHYLCPMISEMLDGHHGRIDTAISMFVAGELPEDCVMSEADFALWTNNELEIPWAYLAKSFYYKFNSDKSDEYLEQVCDSSRNGDLPSVPCQIAQTIQEGGTIKDNKILNETLTGQILGLREMLSDGEYSRFLKDSRQLASYVGFNNFIQKETVKALWGSNLQKQAEGAYLNMYSHVEPTHQIEIASWMCLEEVESECAVKNYNSCDDLKTNFKRNSMTGLTTDSVIALIKEKDCAKDSSISMLYFHEFFEENPLVQDLVGAISKESNWSKEKRLDTLRKLAFSISATRSIRHRAQMALLEMSDESKDAEQILSYLERSTHRDWFWKKLSNKVAKLEQTKWKSLAHRTDRLFDTRAPASMKESK